MDNELQQAKLLFDRATRTRYTLRSKLAAARKHVRWGNEETAKITAATLPSLERKLAEAEELCARARASIESAKAKKLARPAFVPTGNSQFTAAELAIPEDCSIPLFLQRTTSQPDPVG